MKTSQNILIIDENIGNHLANPFEPVGGATVQSLAWAEGFVKKGYLVHILTISPSMSLITEYQLHFYNTKPNQNNFLSGLFNLVFLLKLVKKLNPLCLYLSTAGWKTIQWGVVARLLKVNYVQRISNNIVFAPVVYKKKHGYLKYYLSYLGVRMSNLILCQNRIQAENIKRIFPMKKWMIIHNPVSSSIKPPSSSRNGRYVAWIGIFQYQKNLPALYFLAKELKSVKFKIAGVAQKKIDDNTSIAIANLRELDNVEFVGMVTPSARSVFLENAYCLLNTSLYEGFSNTFLEAFLSGVPIITRRIIDPDGIIEKNNLGIIVEGYSEMIDAIEKITTNYDDYTDRVYQYVIENHNPTILVERVILQLEEN